jgi:hypothetical protein
MANALSKLLNTTGPERTAWLERQLEPVKNALSAAAYYVPPELRQTGGQVANALAMMSPGADVMDAAQSSGDMMDAARRGDFMGVAGAGAGIAAAGLGMFVPGTAKGYGSAAEEVAGMLKSGRGADITDEMIAKADPAELFDLYGAGKTGMDMPMDEASRMARAQGMGFDTAAYHGTSRDFPRFDLSAEKATDSGWFGNAAYASPDPDVAADYAKGAGAGGNIQPLIVNMENPWVTTHQTYNQDYIDRLRSEEGIDSIVRTDNESLPISQAQEFAIFDPASIRSRFARFDPRLKHLANLSAAGAGVIGYNALRDERDRNEQGGM